MSAEVGKVWYQYHARRVATQGNAAGGAIVLDLTCTVPFYVLRLSAINSGTNTLRVAIGDEDGNTIAMWGSLSSAAANNLTIPRSYTATTSTIVIDSSHLLSNLVAPGSTLTVFQSEAGVQNDTLAVSIQCLMQRQEPLTWDKSRSTNAANVTLATSTISTTNTWKSVMFP